MVYRFMKKTDIEHFNVTFCGDGLTAMDVRDLAPSLLALADAIKATHDIVSTADDRITLRVRGGFQRGSLEVALEISRECRQWLDVFKGLDVPSAAAILVILGLGATVGGKKIVGVIQLLRAGKGEEPVKKIQVKKEETVTVTFDGVEPMDVDRTVMAAFDSPEVRDGLRGFVKPLNEDGIDLLTVGASDEPRELIKSQEAVYFEGVPTTEETEDKTIETEVEMLLRIRSPFYTEGKMWRFDHGGTPIQALISDKSFVERYMSGERFGSNDHMHAIVKITESLADSTSKVTYEIVEVVDVKKPIREKELIPKMT